MNTIQANFIYANINKKIQDQQKNTTLILAVAVRPELILSLLIIVY